MRESDRTSGGFDVVDRVPDLRKTTPYVLSQPEPPLYRHGETPFWVSSNETCSRSIKRGFVEHPEYWKRPSDSARIAIEIEVTLSAHPNNSSSSR